MPVDCKPKKCAVSSCTQHLQKNFTAYGKKSKCKLFNEFILENNLKECGSELLCNTHYWQIVKFEKNHTTSKKRSSEMLEIQSSVTKKSANQCPGLDMSNYQRWIHNNKICDDGIEIAIIENETLFSKNCKNTISSRSIRCYSCSNLKIKLDKWNQRNNDTLKLSTTRFDVKKHLQHPTLIQEKINNIRNKLKIYETEIPENETKLYQQLLSCIENYENNNRILPFYLIRLQDELFRKINPNTTKEHPPEVLQFWEYIKYHSSSKVLERLKGASGETNFHVPNPDTISRASGGPIYGHLYTKQKVDSMINNCIGRNNSCICVISWDLMTVRKWLTYGQNGYVFGLATGPISHTEILQKKSISEEELAKKVIVFQLIDVCGNFTYTVAGFTVPNVKYVSFILKKLHEIYNLWNKPDFKIVGSVSDGEFKVNIVENFMNRYVIRWIHCEDYIHILKRLRNPLIDSNCEVSMVSITYLLSKFPHLNKMINRSDVIVKDEMNVDSCLKLIKPEFLKALEEIKANLIKKVPELKNFTRGRIIYDSLELFKYGESFPTLDEKHLQQLTLEETKKYFQNLTQFPDLSDAELIFTVSSILEYLTKVQLFYNSCHSLKMNLKTKMKNLHDCFLYFKNQLDIISYPTLMGIVSIYRMYKHIISIYLGDKSSKEVVTNTEQENDEEILQDNSILPDIPENIDTDQIQGTDDGTTSEISEDLDEIDDNSSDYHSTVSDLAMDLEDLIEFEFNADSMPLITSTISSNILELLFSEIQSKSQNICDYEFFSILGKAIRCVNIEHLDDITRSFSVIKKRKSKHYKRNNIKFSVELPLPNNKLKDQVIKRDEVIVLLQQVNQKTKQFKLRQNSQVVNRTNSDIICSVCGKGYSSVTFFEKHLDSMHQLGKDKSQYISKTISCSQGMTSAIRQKINRFDRLKKWNEQKAKERKLELIFDSELESSQLNDTQDLIRNESFDVLPSLKDLFPEGLTSIPMNSICQDITEIPSNTNTTQNSKPKTKTKCKVCKGNGHKDCGSCKKCCLKVGGCKHHQICLVMKSQPTDYDIIILDSETTDFKVRSLTDLYAINLSKRQTIEFKDFIRPRTKIEREVVKLTQISNEMVRNGTREFTALDQLSANMGKKAIILAHNASFDRDAIYKSIVYWKRKNRISNFKSQDLIFVDTLPLFKDKLRRGNLASNKLGDIYYDIFGKEIENQHRAKSDVDALYKCLTHPTMFGGKVPLNEGCF